MDNDLLSIGDVARASGLSVSALRFYDRVGVLSPVVVDSQTAYRWYSPDQLGAAELIAELRRVGLSLPEVTTILAHQGDGKLLHEMLGGHVARLEQALVNAKAVIAKIEQRWNPATATQPRSISVDSRELRRALSSVRFAVGTDAEFPNLRGILMRARNGQLQLTATDRHRAAFYALDIGSGSHDFDLVLAEPGLDPLLAALHDGDTACLTCTSQLNVSVGGKAINLPLLDHNFPDLTEKVQSSSGVVRVNVERRRLRSALGTYPAGQQQILQVGPAGQLLMDLDNGSDPALLLNAAFLSDALDSAVGEALSLEVNGPVAPLAIRSIEHPYSFSVIMPILKP